MTDTILPMISRDEELAIARLHAASFNLLEVVRSFVRNRRSIHADEPFVDPLHRLMNMAEAVLEQAGFSIDGVALGRRLVDITLAHLVIIESPFAGELTRNIAYARQAMRDSLLRGEHPIASHLLYPQPGILDDNDAEDRKRGIEAGLAWRKAAGKAVFYTGRGWSRGMAAAREVYDREGFPYEIRDMVAVPPGVTYPANMPFPADPFGMADRHESQEGLFDGERIVPAEELVDAVA
ncbi:MAG: hypothetical protein ACJ75S_07090 [Solirubrobacterales bacterium]|jgi:hypothetical protein